MKTTHKLNILRKNLILFLQLSFFGLGSFGLQAGTELPEKAADAAKTERYIIVGQDLTAVRGYMQSDCSI